MTLVLDNLSKSYGGSSGVNLVSHRFENGKRFAILGRSGVGKTTLLNLISGITMPDGGRILIPDKILKSYVFQDFPLFPWRTVSENIRVPTEIHVGQNRNESIDFDVAIDKTGLTSWLNHYPAALSGGMKQRVAIIQALRNESDLLLLDEPFSSLDFESKIAVQRIVVDWFYKQARVIILVTHDLEDAVALTDSAIILADRPGRIVDAIDFNFLKDEIDPLQRRRTHQFAEYVNQLMTKLQW